MTKILTLFLAEQTTPVAQPQGNPLLSMLPLILLMGGLYFIMIAPQRKKQKAQEKMLAALKTGDDVLTSGGIFGTIANVKDDRFVVRIAENVKVEVPKGFIQSVVVKSDGGEKK